MIFFGIGLTTFDWTVRKEHVFGAVSELFFKTPCKICLSRLKLATGFFI